MSTTQSQGGASVSTAPSIKPMLPMRDMEEGKETLFDGCTKVKPKKDLEKYTDMVLSPQ